MTCSMPQLQRTMGAVLGRPRRPRFLEPSLFRPKRDLPGYWDFDLPSVRSNSNNINVPGVMMSRVFVVITLTMDQEHGRKMSSAVSPELAVSSICPRPPACSRSTSPFQLRSIFPTRDVH